MAYVRKATEHDIGPKVRGGSDQIEWIFCGPVFGRKLCGIRAAVPDIAGRHSRHADLEESASNLHCGTRGEILKKLGKLVVRQRGDIVEGTCPVGKRHEIDIGKN